MIFNSFDFLVFFIIVLTAHYLLPHKFRWVLLLISSLIFYMAWRAELVFLILFTSFSNYYLSLKIYNNRQKGKKYLIIALITNFGILFVFKYMMFVNHTFMAIYEYFNLTYPINDFNIILPMGISFYTFQAISYTIDVYRKEYEPEKNYFKFTLFITFFPQLVAGPIERADRLLNQLFTVKRFKIENMITGSKIMLIGFFKKVVIADRVAHLVDGVYNDIHNYNSLAYIFATLLFTFQIYCDFSGYSDIAKGCAKTLGIDLMDNFRSPYFSKSIKEFWKRWHISLSTWFRDYLYIPLGGNRVTKLRNYYNLLVTFLVSGLWHGANWTFVLWGGLHGIYQIIGSIKNNIFKTNKINFFPLNIIRILTTFVLVSFAWIFFRANTISDAFYIVKNLFNDIDLWTEYQYLYDTLNSFSLNVVEIIISVSSIMFLLLSEFVKNNNRLHNFVTKIPLAGFSYYTLIAIIILTTGVFDSGGEFIYFQF